MGGDWSAGWIEIASIQPADQMPPMEARMALYRLQILKQPAVPKMEAGLLSIRKNVGDPILDMRSDYTTPVLVPTNAPQLYFIN